MEDHLLENDFSYDAMEGLEQVPWGECQRQLDATEARIVDEFSLEPGPGLNKTIAIAVAGLLVTIASVWYFSNSTPETVDLTATERGIASPAPTQDIVQQETDSSSGIPVNPEQQINDVIPETDETQKMIDQPKKVSPKKGSKVVVQDNMAHITVGRVVDTKGIPITDAVVSSGAVSDTTDKSGYYALKIVQGGTRIEVTHLATSYLVEIDTNQNWEIVLDIVHQTVMDYYPMHAANRFK